MHAVPHLACQFHRGHIMPFPASLAARDERKEAPSQKRQGSLEKTISTAMNDLLGPHLDTASYNSIPRLLERPNRG